jgi:hypothetical protein
MALEYKALPVIEVASGATSGWLDISAFSTLSIQVNQATGSTPTHSWAIEFSNDETNAVTYATGVEGADIIGAGGMLRSAVGTYPNANNPIPVGTRFVRITASNDPATMLVCGLVDTNANRNWINRNS